MKYTLSSKERMSLMDVLPRQADIVKARLILKLRDQLEFTKEEIAVLKLKQKQIPNAVGSRLVGDWDKLLSKEMEIDDDTVILIQQLLTLLSRQGRLTVDPAVVSLWSLFNIPDAPADQRSQ